MPVVLAVLTDLAVEYMLLTSVKGDIREEWRNPVFEQSPCCANKSEQVSARGFQADPDRCIILWEEMIVSPRS